MSFEKAPTQSKTASAGWYNNKAFETRAAQQGLYAKTLDGDAFSDAMREQVLETIKADLGQIDLVVYSLASPVRQHPKTDVLHRSSIKPLGEVLDIKTVHVEKGEVSNVALEPATEQEIADLIARYPDLPAGQLSDFKDPERFQDWDDKYAELLVHQGFAKALISTRKNHDSRELDRIHAALQDSDIPVTTIWGDSDTVVVYADFAEKIDRLLPRRVEHFVPASGHLPHMENQPYFEALLTDILALD